MICCGFFHPPQSYLAGDHTLATLSPHNLADLKENLAVFDTGQSAAVRACSVLYISQVGYVLYGSSLTGVGHQIAHSASAYSSVVGTGCHL